MKVPFEFVQNELRGSATSVLAECAFKSDHFALHFGKLAFNVITDDGAHRQEHEKHADGITGGGFVLCARKGGLFGTLLVKLRVELFARVFGVRGRRDVERHDG